MKAILIVAVLGIIIRVITASLCTEGNHTCDFDTQKCVDLEPTDGQVLFTCECLDMTKQLSPQNTCVPIPEDQKIHVVISVSLQDNVWEIWEELQNDATIRHMLDQIFPPALFPSLKTIKIVTTTYRLTEGFGKFSAKVSLIFFRNVTSDLRLQILRRVVYMESKGTLETSGQSIPVDSSTGIFNTEDRMMISDGSSDDVDWCSLADLFSCRNHSTCVDTGFRYTCHCNDGYYDSNNECHELLRIVDSTGPRDGRLEYWQEGRWSTVCYHGFTLQTAAVACRQLGFPARGPDFSEDKQNSSSAETNCKLQAPCQGSERVLSQCSDGLLQSSAFNNVTNVRIACDTVCKDDVHYGVNCTQRCVCNFGNTASCDRHNGTCYCKSGWEGITCSEDTNECLQTPGACIGECVNTNGSFVCVETTSSSQLFPDDRGSSSKPPTVIIAISTSVVAVVVLIVIVIVIAITVRGIRKQRGQFFSKDYQETTLS